MLGWVAAATCIVVIFYAGCIMYGSVPRGCRLAVRRIEDVESLAALEFDDHTSNHTKDADKYRCCCTGPAAKTCLIQDIPEKTGSCVSGDDYIKYRADKPKECTTGEKAKVAAAAQAGIPVTIVAYWMRHGWSCANALKQQGKESYPSGWGKTRAWADSKKFWLYADPSLTDAGVYRAIALGKHIRPLILDRTAQKQPLVFSSTLVRAMETALFNFPDWDVRPIPYIAEDGITRDNTPLPYKQQLAKKLKRAPASEKLLRHIRFDENSVEHPDRDSGSKSDYEAFKAYFPALLHKLIEAKEVDLTVSSGDEIPVVIVGHSNYMKGNLQCGKTEEGNGKARNNEVWVQKYTVNLGAWNARLEEVPDGCSSLIRNSSFYPMPPDVLCEQDVARCGVQNSNMKPQRWLERDAAACRSLGGKQIDERDRRKKVPLPYAIPPMD